MTRKVLLLTIGADALPETTPIVPISTTTEVAVWTSPALEAPASLTATATVDGAVLEWPAVDRAQSFVVQTAPDVSGVPGTWSDFAWPDPSLRLCRLTRPATAFWYRVLAVRNGKRSPATDPVFVPAWSSEVIAALGVIGDEVTRDGAAWWMTPDGLVKLGSVQVNYGAAWSSGAAISYVAEAGTPATATISVTSGRFTAGDWHADYAAASVNVTGTNGETTTYYLYIEDPGLRGGALTLYASTDPKVTYNSNNRVLVGAVAVAFPSSGSGSGSGSTPGGGGGRPCPEVSMWVLTPDGPKRAGDVRVGDLLRLCCPATLEECWGEVTRSDRHRTPGVRLHGHAGADLSCSTSAPIPTAAGYVLAPDTEGHWTLGRRGRGIARERIVKVDPLGEIEVQRITVGDRCFWVGADPGHLLLHHNIKAGDPLDP